MTRDPICGMTVNADNEIHAERDEQTHYSGRVSSMGFTLQRARAQLYLF